MSPLESELSYPFGDNLPASGAALQVAPGVRWLRMGLPFALNHINLWLVEDCCDALGSTYNGQMCGTFGDIATLSFYPAHHITMGEGGAVFTNNYELKQIAESFRDWGRDCYCPPGKDNTCGKRFCWKLGNNTL